jgi:hypothetical protein
LTLPKSCCSNKKEAGPARRRPYAPAKNTPFLYGPQCFSGHIIFSPFHDSGLLIRHLLQYL